MVLFNTKTTPTPPIMLNYVVGYRSWNIKKFNTTFYLSPKILVNDNILWPHSRTFVASCYFPYTSSHIHDVPDIHCQCGIYANKEDISTWGATTGSVALWGNVIEHELGYRAQYAYPLSLNRPVCTACCKTANSMVLPIHEPTNLYSMCKKCLLIHQISSVFKKQIIYDIDHVLMELKDRYGII